MIRQPELHLPSPVRHEPISDYTGVLQSRSYPGLKPFARGLRILGTRLLLLQHTESLINPIDRIHLSSFTIKDHARLNCIQIYLIERKEAVKWESDLGCAGASALFYEFEDYRVVLDFEYKPKENEANPEEPHAVRPCARKDYWNAPTRS